MWARGHILVYAVIKFLVTQQLKNVHYPCRDTRYEIRDTHTLTYILPVENVGDESRPDPSPTRVRFL